MQGGSIERSWKILNVSRNVEKLLSALSVSRGTCSFYIYFQCVSRSIYCEKPDEEKTAGVNQSARSGVKVAQITKRCLLLSCADPSKNITITTN
jgi:hypothetical protein